MTMAADPRQGIEAGQYHRYFDALLAGDRRVCAEILQQLLDQDVPLKSLYLDLVQRSMVEIGDLWERNLVSVATEHVATVVTEALLATLYPRLFAQPHRDRRAVIACVPQEYHQIGARIVADFFELHGWHGFSLGANTPVAGLLQLIRERDPDIVGVSMSMLFNRPQLERMLDAVSGEFPDLDLLLGGRAFAGEGAGREAREEIMERFPRLRYLASLDELEAFLQRD